AIQNIVNLNQNNNFQKNNIKNNKANKKGKEKTIDVLIDKTKNAEKSFKKLVEEKAKDKGINKEKFDLSELLDMLKLSSKELKEKIAKMNKDELKNLEEMTQIALASILEKLNNEDLLKKLESTGISKDFLKKLQSKLSFMQESITKRKKELNIATDENKFFKLNSNDNSTNSKNDNSTNSNKDKSINSNKEKNNTKTVKLSKEGIKTDNQKDSNSKNNQGKTNGEVEKNSKSTIKLNGRKIEIPPREEMSQREKIYYDTLRKQASTKQEIVDKTSLNLKSEAKNNLAAEMNSELKGKLDFKELSKNNNLKNLLSKENLTNEQNSVKRVEMNNSSSFNNFFNNGEDGNLNLNFNLQNLSQMTQSSDSNLVQNNSQFQSAVLNSTQLTKQITDKIKVLDNPAKNQIKIQLEPEFLGKLKMDVKVDGSKINARFMVDNVLVKNHLDQNISLLRSSLSEQGFNIDNIEIEAENTEYDMSDSNQGGFFEQFNQNDRNQRKFSYQDYEELTSEILNLDSEKLEEIFETNPQKLKKWGYMQDSNWFGYGGYYSQMSFLA
ncbi:MAG: flagellar hook-length control protein FliK, partial [Bacillota bacterium]